jgi:hypothetical protein
MKRHRPVQEYQRGYFSAEARLWLPQVFDRIDARIALDSVKVKPPVLKKREPTKRDYTFGEGAE